MPYNSTPKSRYIMINQQLKLFGSILAYVMIPLAGQAFPASAVNTDNSCKTCHSVIVSDRMKVELQPLQADLIEQLNGKTRGQLETFVVEPGATITMSMDVLNGADKWSVQFKRLEKEGQALSQDNFMIWNNPGNAGWNIQGASSAQPYFTTDIGEDTAPTAKSFTLTIDASTPPDVYDLEFAIAGKSGNDLFYQDEHFYLAVGMDFWNRFPVLDQGVVNTGPWLEYINLQAAPWVWSYSLSNWIYLPEDIVTDSGAWTYILQIPTTSTADKNLGGLVYDKFYAADAGGSGEKVNFSRCKACHGWDGMGLNGGYVRRTANLDRPKPIVGGDLSAKRGSITADQVWHTNGRSFGVEDNTMPDYSQAGGLTADQVANVVAFLNSGEQIADYATLDITANPVAYTFNGTDAAAGATLYTNSCASCHSADGTGLGLNLASYFSKDGKYSEGFHKMIYGIPDTIMSRAAQGELTGLQAANILTYIQAEIGGAFPTN